MGGKNINIFLMDGSSDGRIKCSMANWTGVAYKIPRTEIDNCKEIRLLKQSGVYFLFGTNEETGENTVYIGQAGTRKSGEGILIRLQEHKNNPDKEYWREAIAFTTSNNSFGPTEITYLEHQFCKMAKDANRYEVLNGNEPAKGNPTEEKECELQEFIDYAVIIMGAVGHKVFVPIAGEIQDKNLPVTEHKHTEPLLHMKLKDAHATGQLTSDGLVVFKGSKLIAIPVPHCLKYIKRSRNKHKARIDSNNILLQDTLFQSPSGAASFVAYGSRNGWTEWKTEDGRTLKEIESQNK